MVRVEGNYALLDYGAGVRAICADDAEAEIEQSVENRTQSEEEASKHVGVKNKRVLVVGLGKIDMVFAVGFVFLTDAGMQPPIIFSTVLVVTTGLSSKNTPAWLNILVPSDKPGKVFTLKITAPLHCGQTVLSKRLMAGKSNLTTLFKPSFIMAIFIVFEAMTIFSDAGFTVAGKVSIT